MTTLKLDSNATTKLITMLITFTLSLCTFATTSTEQQADELFNKRDIDVKYAKQAVDIYGELAALEKDSKEMARLTLKQVKATYAMATFSGEDKNIYTNASNLAKKVVDLFSDPQDFDEEELRLQALYWYAAAIARSMSLTTLGTHGPKVEEATNEILNNDSFSDAYYHGARRVIGRVYYKVPRIFKLGSKSNKIKSRRYLQKAFEGTLKEGEEKVSVYGLNNLYYADILKYFNENDEACRILKTFSQQDPQTLLEGREAETTVEIEQAKEKLKEFKCQS